ncbi:hypothetical protein [Streptomyces sp. BF23-19]
MQERPECVLGSGPGTAHSPRRRTGAALTLAPLAALVGSRPL